MACMSVPMGPSWEQSLRVSEQHPEAWSLLDALLYQVTTAHRLADEASKVSAEAIKAAGIAREAEGELLRAARNLQTALAGGAGSDKPPSLGDAVKAARELLLGPDDYAR